MNIIEKAKSGNKSKEIVDKIMSGKKKLDIDDLWEKED